MESKYLVFKELAPKPKTKVYEVVSKSNGEHLGFIRWHGAWRQYCFFSCDNYSTVWSKGCLEDLTIFIQELKEKVLA